MRLFQPTLACFAHTCNSFVSENPIVAKIQYWMKITFVFILILFIDSVNRVYRVQLELSAATEQTSKGSYVPTPKATPPLC